jgi:hypothetical protein
MTSLFTTTQHIFSGICICGHKYTTHHGQVIARREVSLAMKSGTWYCECLAFGCNENWEPCPDCPKSFIDKDDPLKEEKLNE